MKQNDVYMDLDGNALSLAGLDAHERRLVARLRRRARTRPDWNDFDNYRTRVLNEFYDARGLARSVVVRTLPWRIAQDLSSRLGVAAGTVRPPDYRDDLEDLIATRFGTRRAFCRATGLSEDLLSHVLAGRKDFSVSALTKGLERIGYRLAIAAGPRRKRTG